MMQYSSREVYEHISKTTNDPIVEWKICAASGVEFPIYQSDVEFYDKISPTFGEQKFQIPTPTLCPEERQRRRLSFRNERRLYHRKCDFSGNNTLSIYSPDKPYIVYDHKIRWSDDWNPLDYGRDFDFNTTFTQNFESLMLVVPRTSIHVIGNENCDYLNQCGYSQNCYLSFNTDFSESCFYTKDCDRCEYCIDCLNGKQSHYCYMCINMEGCHNCYYSQHIINSSELYSCTNMTGCHHCINCHDLTNQSYCIDNVEIGKQARENHHATKILGYINNQTIKEQRTQNNSEHCIGSDIHNTQSAILSYNIHDCQNVKYSYDFIDSQDSYDHSTGGYKTTLCYELISSGDHNHHCIFSAELRGNDTNLYYSQFCIGCQDCLGCIGLRNKQYCVFNKQYSKDDYEIVMSKIIGHMIDSGERGEFFHSSLSPFGYNETVAQEYYPLSKEEATQRGLSWQDLDYPINVPSSMETVLASQLPNIDQVSDDILTKAIICEVSGKPFRIIKAELAFYRKHDISLPRKHPDIRHEERMKLRPGRTLYLRTCDCCGKEMLSVYARHTEGSETKGRIQDSPSIDSSLHSEGQQKVYCEECYQKDIYS